MATKKLKEKVPATERNVRVNAELINQVKEQVSKTNGRVGRFYDDAVREKLQGGTLLENLERIIERIEEQDLQKNFPSAYERAKRSIEQAKSK